MTTIEEIASTLGVPQEDVEAEVEKNLANMAPDAPEAVRRGRAINQAAMTLKRQVNAIKRTTLVEGFLAGATDLKDFLDWQRGKAAEAFKKDPEKAVFDGLTDRDGNPLDTQEKRFNKENPNYGKPLDATGHNYQRTFYAILRKKNGDTVKFCRIRFNGKLAPKIKFYLWRPVAFQAILKSKDEDPTWRLNASVATKFMGLVDNPFDPESVLKDMRVIPLDGLDNELARMGEKDKEKLVWTKGIVNTLYMELSKYNSRSMTLDAVEASSDPIRVYIPSYVPIDFGEGSEVMVLGRLSQSKATEQRESRITINAYGVYASPDQKIAIPPMEAAHEDIGAIDDAMAIEWQEPDT